MRYAGGKSRQTKRIAEYINTNILEGQDYLEPFCGAYSVGNLVKTTGVRYAGDADADIISLLSSVQQGWMPPDNIDEKRYYDIIKNKDLYDDELYAFAAYGCSFGGIKGSTYARDSKGTNYAKRTKEGLLKMNLDGVVFKVQSYESWNPEGVFIYCDPPYTNTSTLTITNSFQFNPFDFWDLMCDWAKTNTVIVTERFVPSRHTKEIMSWSRSGSTNNTKESKRGAVKEGLYSVK